MPSPMPQRVNKPRRAKESRSCPAHRACVRRHHCSVPGGDILPVDYAHVRKGTNGGTDLKPSDSWTISLCRLHHAEQHQIGESAFEIRYSLDLIAISEEFARRSKRIHRQIA